MVKSVPHFKYFSSALKAPLKTTDFKAKEKNNNNNSPVACKLASCDPILIQVHFLKWLGNKL